MIFLKDFYLINFFNSAVSGSAVLGIIGACFGAAAPSPNEFKLLRNEILNGISDMFDAQQKADAMGCVYKLEFLTEILDVQDSERFSDEEFNALIIVSRGFGDIHPADIHPWRQ